MRNKLIEKLANEMRNAETYFLKTEDDSKKWKVVEKIRKYRLTKEEKQEFDDITNSMGV